MEGQQDAIEKTDLEQEESEFVFGFTLLTIYLNLNL